MQQVQVAAPLPAPDTTLPAIHALDMSDLRAALAAGWSDFRAAPTQLFFLCVLYPVAALIFGRLAAGGSFFPLLYPVAFGFALVGPIAAVGLYEVRRRRERGLEAGWRPALDVLREPGITSVAILGLGLVVIFLVWVGIAQAIYALTLGTVPYDGMMSFAHRVFATQAGWAMIILGNLAGLGFAALVLATAVFSIPMALDRAVLPQEAIRISLASVARNPRTMAAWGVIVGVLLLLGSLPAFIGLAVVMPVLSHATWHLYRRAIG